ncbi:hypothetical protein D3C84_555910 [compost metagenome]
MYGWLYEQQGHSQDYIQALMGHADVKMKAVNKLLFTAFGLGQRLRHERDRATNRLAKKATKLGGTLTGWARNALLIGWTGAPKFRPPARKSSGSFLP